MRAWARGGGGSGRVGECHCSAAPPWACQSFLSCGGGLRAGVCWGDLLERAGGLTTVNERLEGACHAQTAEGCPWRERSITWERDGRRATLLDGAADGRLLRYRVRDLGPTCGVVLAGNERGRSSWQGRLRINLGNFKHHQAQARECGHR